MPKLRAQNIRPPGPRQRLTDELRSLYGGALTLTDLKETVGLKEYAAIKRWLKTSGLEAIDVNGRKKWLASDVARALDNSKAMDG